LRIDNLDFPLRNLHLRCHHLESGAGRLWCRSLSAKAALGPVDAAQIIDLSLEFEFDWGRSELLAWSVSIVDATVSTGLLQQFLSSTLAPPVLSDITLTDSLLALTVTAAGHGSQVEQVSGSLAVTQFGFSNQWGTQAGEGLDAEIGFSITQQNGQGQTPDSYQFDTYMTLLAGDVFLNPLFLSLASDPASTAALPGIRLKARGRWQAADRLLSLNMSYQHSSLLDIGGSVELEFVEETPKLINGFGRIRLQQLAQTYPVYLQPLVSETLFDDLNSAGQITARGSYHHQRGVTSFGLQLDQLKLIDQQQRFAIEGLTANLPYMGSGQSSRGKLAWDSLQLYRLPFGAGSSSIHFYQLDGLGAAGQTGSMLALQISPVKFLDGLLKAGQVSIAGLGSDQLELSLGGEIEPVSLAKLSVALGWPEMAGSVSGVLPAARYRNGRITLDGTLGINVFDGQIKLEHLQIENLFSLVPRFSADLTVDQLDLGMLTNTFEFGAITGRTSGYINQLQMESWQPVAFDSWFQTPAKDPGPHKISQRALNSLSSVGGIGGALQSTLLRFFDDFSYRRLGIGCKLSNGVCQMRGIADYGDGYFIVQGGGFWPQIDLVGYNREVDWPVLLQRISAAAGAEQLEFR